MGIRSRSFATGFFCFFLVFSGLVSAEAMDEGAVFSSIADTLFALIGDSEKCAGYGLVPGDLNGLESQDMDLYFGSPLDGSFQGKSLQNHTDLFSRNLGRLKSRRDKLDAERSCSLLFLASAATIREFSKFPALINDAFEPGPLSETALFANPEAVRDFLSALGEFGRKNPSKLILDPVEADNISYIIEYRKSHEAEMDFDSKLLLAPMTTFESDIIRAYFDKLLASPENAPSLALSLSFYYDYSMRSGPQGGQPASRDPGILTGILSAIFKLRLAGNTSLAGDVFQKIKKAMETDKDPGNRFRLKLFENEKLLSIAGTAAEREALVGFFENLRFAQLASLVRSPGGDEKNLLKWAAFCDDSINELLKPPVRAGESLLSGFRIEWEFANALLSGKADSDPSLRKLRDRLVATKAGTQPASVNEADYALIQKTLNAVFWAKDDARRLVNALPDVFLLSETRTGSASEQGFQASDKEKFPAMLGAAALICADFQKAKPPITPVKWNKFLLCAYSTVSNGRFEPSTIRKPLEDLFNTRKGRVSRQDYLLPLAFLAAGASETELPLYRFPGGISDEGLNGLIAGTGNFAGILEFFLKENDQASLLVTDGLALPLLFFRMYEAKANNKDLLKITDKRNVFKSRIDALKEYFSAREKANPDFKPDSKGLLAYIQRMHRDEQSVRIPVLTEANAEDNLDLLVAVIMLFGKREMPPSESTFLFRLSEAFGKFLIDQKRSFPKDNYSALYGGEYKGMDGKKIIARIGGDYSDILEIMDGIYADACAR